MSLSIKRLHPLMALAGAGMLFGSMGPSSAQTPPDIKAAVGYTVAGGPAFVTAADLNGDGRAELITANGSGNNVAVLVSNLGGTFKDAAFYDAGGTAPTSIAVGDFNGDGKADLAVSNSGGTSVGILAGNGNATFNTATPLDVGGNPGWVATGDLNGDGKADLVVTRTNANQVATYLSNGNGTFNFGTEAATGTGPKQIVVSDCTNDQKADVAVTGEDGSIGVYEGAGDGTFTTTKVLTLSSFITNLSGIASANFNKAGTNDLVVTRLGAPGFIPNVGIGLDYDPVNQKLGKTNTANAGNEPASVAVPDLSGDGNADLLIANRASNDVSYLTGNGDGKFTAAGTFAGLGGGLVSVATGDFGNGKISFAAAEPSQNRLDVFLNGDFNSTPAFQPYTDVPLGHVFYEPIKALTLKGFVSGFDCGGTAEPCDTQNSKYFRPSFNITKAQAAAWVSSASDKTVDPGENPNSTITRGQLARMISDAKGYTDTPTAPSFADVPADNPFFTEIERLKAHGAAAGYACGGSSEPCNASNTPYFRPFAAATRGQAARYIALAFVTDAPAPESVSKPAGTGNVRVDFGPIALNLNVTAEGQITVQSTDAFGLFALFAPPAGYSLTNDSLAFELTSSAALGGDQEVCISVPNALAQYKATGRLKVLHGEGGVLVDRTDPAASEAGLICAKVTSFSPFVLAIAPGLSLGDVDGSGAVDVGDAVTVLRNIVGQADLNADQTFAADVDITGAVDVSDAVAILRVVVGLDPAFSQP